MRREVGFEGMGTQRERERERERERLFLLLTASLGLESEGACCRTTRHIAVRETAIITFNTLRNCGCILEQSVPANIITKPHKNHTKILEEKSQQKKFGRENYT